MPVACAGPVTIPPIVVPKYAYLHHDSGFVNVAPPIQNQWYTVFEDEDVRVIRAQMRQTNGASAALDVEWRYTVDGLVYAVSFSLPHNALYDVWRDKGPSPGGISVTATLTEKLTAAMRVDLRGQSVKAKVRLVGAPGANQTLQAWGVYETLEVT